MNMPTQKPSSEPKSFPHKLYALLESSTDNGYSNIISWQHGGKSFKVHQPKVFVKSILPRSFKQTKFKSFLRQLNMYGFQRIQYGPNKGGYTHERLKQGAPDSCHMINRLSVRETKAAPAIASSKAVSRKRPEISCSMNVSSGNSISGMSFSGLSAIHSIASNSSLVSLVSLDDMSPVNAAADRAPYSGDQNAPFTFGTQPLSEHEAAFQPRPFYSVPDQKQNESDLSLLGNLTTREGGMQTLNGTNGSTISVLSALSFGSKEGVHRSLVSMDSSDLDFLKEVFDSSVVEPDALPLSIPSSDTAGHITKPPGFIAAKQNATFDTTPMLVSMNQETAPKLLGVPEYVISNGFLEKTPGLLEPTTDELLELVTSEEPTQPPSVVDYPPTSSSSSMPQQKHEDLNRSESVFPTKLHRMLQDAKREGFEDVISWIHGGTAFKIHDVTEFMEQIMPIYFDQSKFESFRRQMNLYGFTRVSRGPGRGMYYHQDFVQNDVGLCKNITRRKGVRKPRTTIIC